MTVATRLAVAAMRRGQRSTVVMMFVVVTLAAGGVAASLSIAGSSTDRLDEAFTSAAGPHVVVTAELEREQSVLAAARGDEEVVEVGDPRPARHADMNVDAEHRLQHLLTVLEPSQGRLGAPVIRSGRAPSSADEIALDAGVAIDLDLGVGDRVSFVASEGTASPDVEFVIVGTAYDFADCFHPSCDPARSWLAPTGMTRLGGPSIVVTSVALTDAERGPDVEQRLVERVGDGLGVNTWIDTRGDLLNELEFFAIFLGVFGLFVLAASAVVIAASLAARTAARRRSIGLAKAVGCSPVQLTLAIVIEHVSVGLIAGVTGWGLAMLLVPHLRTGPLAVIGAPGPQADIGGLLITLAVVTTIVLIATIGPASRAACLSTVAALRGAPRPRRRVSRIAESLTRRLPWSIALGARRWVARPMRRLGAALSLILALTAGIVSISINHSMNYLLAHPAQSGDPWDVALSPNPAIDQAQLERRLDVLPSVARWHSIIDSRATVEGERVHVRLLGGDPEAAAYAIGAGRRLRTQNEAIVGYGLYDEFGWSIGQSIDLTFDGNEKQFVLVGWYRETEDGGHIIQVREPTTTSSDESRTYALTAADETTKAGLARDVSTLGGHVAINEPDGASLRPFRLAMSIMALLVTAVALAHMFATALATARSRSCDDAALRAVGVTGWSLSLATGTGTLLTTALAFAIGAPAALKLQRIIGDAITGDIGAGPGITPSPPVLAVTAFAGALAATALLVEIVASRRPGDHQSPAP